MEIALNIPDSKFAHFMELLRAAPYVKKLRKFTDISLNKPEENDDFVPQTKEEMLADLKEAFEEVREIEAGRKRAKPVQELIDELLNNDY